MAYCLAVRPASGERTWTVVDASYATVGPVEEWLEAHRYLWSPNTVRGYATSLAQWWSFLEQRGETGQWTGAGVPVVAGFLSWLRNGRTVEHSLAVPDDAPSAETLHARLAALISFCQWQAAVHDVPVAGRLVRGQPSRAPSRGLLAHLDARRGPAPSSLVKVRRRRRDRPPLLLPQEIQAVIDGCASWDTTAGDWKGNLRDRLIFSVLAETGMRLGEVLGMTIGDFVMGLGGTAYVEVVPRAGNANGARVKMMRPRRVHVGADLERLFAGYLTHLACRAASLGLEITPGSPLLVNLDRPPLLAAMREGTVRDKVTALKRKGIGPSGWTPHWFRHSHASALLLAGTPEWVVSRRLGHAHVQTTVDLYGWVREDEALKAAANWKSYASGWKVSAEGPRLLRPAEAGSPVDRLWLALPAAWRGPVIGPGIEDWARICDHGERRLDLTGLPGQIARELAWMAHWQAADGTRSSVFAMNHLAGILRRAIAEHRPFPDSVLDMDWDAASALQGWFYAFRWGRLPPESARRRLRIVFRFARLALLARCAGGPWWALDEWNPRCDPRIPLTGREPHAGWGGSASRISQPWLREAAKWHLGTMLESGALRWATVSQERMPSLARFSRHLAACFADASGILGDPSAAAGQAAAFARWAADPASRSGGSRRPPEAGGPRLVNDDLRAVADLFAFVAASPAEARRLLGPSPWDGITEAHSASWYRQVSRIPHQPVRTDIHYVDDHALAQILASLPLLGMPRDKQMTITRGDGTQVTARGLDDPQAMRMILLQILTGRRASEVRTCDHDCLPAVTGPAGENGEVTRFRYAQSKIDVAPDTILVDREVTAVIEEQQAWLDGNFPGFPRRPLFLQRTGNRHGSKPYAYGTYNWILREFSDLAGFTDSTGRPVRLSHTHRFRHSRMTRLAELGLPVHVLQRYAGHATPTMTLHYVAQREEHAEQAFLAAVKLKADGTRVTFSREDHDAVHLLGRADRILPNGWCLLPPLQSCGKGNACLTCAVFVTDHSHQQALERQLADTKALIGKARDDFQARHGRPMPGDNVWLAQRQAEHDALARVLDAMNTTPGRAVQGAGCPSAPPAGPVPVTIDTRQPREEQP